MLYALRFRLHLWRHVSGMSLRSALQYPFDRTDGDPVEDAESEMSYMNEG